MKKEAILCLDIGGTNCRMGLVEREGTLLHRQIVSTELLAKGGFVAELSCLLAQYIAEYDSTVRVHAVSMGFPATVDRSRRRVLQAPNIPGLGDDLPICDMLEAALGLPVFLERDVNLLLSYDLRELGLDTQGTTVGIYFGTGIGNSICIDGKFLCGHNGVAGELGHIPQLGSGALCGCGNRDCIEPLGGGRRLSELCQTRFVGTDIKEIYAQHGDTPEVHAQVEAMAVAVAAEVNILDPEYVVLGGGLLQMKDFPSAYFEEQIRTHTRKPYPLQNLRLLYARPNQENGILGAGIYGWKCVDAMSCSVSIDCHAAFCSGVALGSPARE